MIIGKILNMYLTWNKNLNLIQNSGKLKLCLYISYVKNTQCIHLLSQQAEVEGSTTWKTFKYRFFSKNSQKPPQTSKELLQITFCCAFSFERMNSPSTGEATFSRNLVLGFVSFLRNSFSKISRNIK